jgi:hypothetical protein
MLVLGSIAIGLFGLHIVFQAVMSLRSVEAAETALRLAQHVHELMKAGTRHGRH